MSSKLLAPPNSALDQTVPPVTPVAVGQRVRQSGPPVSASVRQHELCGLRRRQISISVLTLFAFLGIWGCSRRVTCPPELLVVAGAYDADCRPYAGTMQVNYELRIAYPADAVISELNSHLEGLGWRQLREDFLNPGFPTSHVDGWSEFLDSTVQPTAVIHQWMADWTNDQGDIVRFALRYTFPRGGKEDLTKLHVFGILLPSKVAHQPWPRAPDDAPDGRAP
jgi:hypothetical protein